MAQFERRGGRAQVHASPLWVVKIRWAMLLREVDVLSGEAVARRVICFWCVAVICVAVACKPEPPPEPPPPPIEVRFQRYLPIEQGERVRSLISTAVTGGNGRYKIHRDASLTIKRRLIEDTSSQTRRAFIEYPRAKTMRGAHPIPLAVDGKSYVMGEEGEELVIRRLDRSSPSGDELSTVRYDYRHMLRPDRLAIFLEEEGTLTEAVPVNVPEAVIALPRGYWKKDSLQNARAQITLQRIEEVRGREVAVLALDITGEVELDVNGSTMRLDMALKGYTKRDIETAREVELSLDGKLTGQGKTSSREGRYSVTLRARNEYPLPTDAPTASPDAEEPVAPDTNNSDEDDLSDFE